MRLHDSTMHGAINGTMYGAAFVAVMMFSLLVPNVMTAAGQAPITAYSIGLDNTAIIGVENGSGENITQVRLWLAEGTGIESFKAEAGWDGIKNSVDVLVFTAHVPVEPGETVQFGIVADNPIASINWKVLSGTEEVAVGVSVPVSYVLPSDSMPPQNPDAGDTPDAPEVPEVPDVPGLEVDSIYEMSSFRIVPERPNVGDTIRVAGMGFAQDRPLSFGINGITYEEFTTDSMGNFVITSSIPDSLEPSRISMEISDDNGNEKKISIRVGEARTGIHSVESVTLQVVEIPPVLYHGEMLQIAGTAEPSSVVTVEVINSDGHTVSVEPRTVDSRGTWVFELLLPQDVPYGQYTARVTQDGNVITRTWEVDSSKVIRIESISPKYDPGDLMVFRGTAPVGAPIQFILENPQKAEVSSDIIYADEDGNVEFTYQTEQSSPDGTYVLFARQGSDTEVIVAGLGELPEEQIILTMEKLNYDSFEDAVIRIDGPSSSTLSILVIDPADKQKHTDDIILPPDGRTSYVLDLDGYGSGVYTIIVSRANTKASQTFAVGLSTGSGSIEITTTRKTYNINDPILILGQTNPNVLITLQLMDPNGTTIREKEAFTDKDGRITDGTFRIPTDGVLGMWEIRASSGPNFDVEEIEVVTAPDEGMQIFIDRIEQPARGEDYVYYSITGAANSVIITIYNDIGREIDVLEARATSDGRVEQPWRVKPDLVPGQYNITAADAFNTASILFELK